MRKTRRTDSRVLRVCKKSEVLTLLIPMKSINKIKYINKKANDLTIIGLDHGIPPIRGRQLGVTLSRQVGEMGRNVLGVGFSSYEFFRN